MTKRPKGDQDDQISRRDRFVSEAGDFRFERAPRLKVPKREPSKQQDKPPGEDY